MKTDKNNIGNAGEYYFAAKLSLLNFVATMTLGRAEKYDILAVSPNKNSYKFSIKSKATSTGEVLEFPVGHKDANEIEDNLFYVFISLNNLEKIPDCWIIPHRDVVKVLHYGHLAWLQEKTGRKDGTMRSMPIKLSPGNRKRFAENSELMDWEKDVEKYYNNFEQLI